MLENLYSGLSEAACVRGGRPGGDYIYIYRTVSRWTFIALCSVYTCWYSSQPANLSQQSAAHMNADQAATAYIYAINSVPTITQLSGNSGGQQLGLQKSTNYHPIPGSMDVSVHRLMIYIQLYRFDRGSIQFRMRCRSHGRREEHVYRQIDRIPCHAC